MLDTLQESEKHKKELYISFPIVTVLYVSVKSPPTTVLKKGC